ncbi:MAG: alpha-amylase family protein [Terriglobia bacterium]
MDRRTFVKSLGVSTGLASLGSIKSASSVEPMISPAAEDPAPPPELRFRQVHLDFHTSPLIPDVGADFNAKDFAQTLKESWIDSINIFAKGHHGMSYYPTKVGVMHPHLKFDLLGQMIEACHVQGIHTPVYISILWDMHAAMNHSDWRVLNENSEVEGSKPLEAGWIRLCPNTPYLDYVNAQAEEVAKNYDADGFWFDILFYPPQGCFCPHCMTEREKLGLDSTRLEDRQKHAEIVEMRTMDRLRSTVRRYKPNALIFFNCRVRVGMRPELKYYTHLEIESLPGGGWGYPYFAVLSRYVRNLGLDYVGMTGRFHRSWGDFGSLRNQAALDYECFRMLAQAGKCSVGDQMHPRGRLVKPVYERIGKTFRSVAEKEPWCRSAQAVTEIGFLSTSHFVNAGELTHQDKGATAILAQLHHQFDALDDDSDFARYKVIILPDTHRFDPELHSKVQQYLAGGGKLILSHESGLDPEGKQFVLPEIGLTYEGPSKFRGNKGDYLEALDGFQDGIPDMVQFTYAAGSEVKALDGTTLLARSWDAYFDRNYLHFSSHHQTAWDKPTSRLAVAQRGNVIYIAFPIFSAYSLNAYAVQRQIVANCIKRLLPQPMVKAEAPSTAEISVTTQQGRQIVHILHYPAERRAPDLDVVEDVIPLVNVNLSLRVSERPAKVYLAPQKEELKIKYNSGYAEVVVPLVHGHQMVVFEA